MKTQTAILLVWRILILTLILFGLYSLDVFGLTLVEEAKTVPGTLLLIAFLHTAVLSYPIIRSRWSGWKLVAAIFCAFYGVTTLMVAVEAVYLPEVLPPDVVLRLLVNGAITAAVFSPLAVLIHGRMKGDESSQETNTRLVMPWAQWAWKLALIALSWAVIFVVFGLLVYLPLAHALAEEYLEEQPTSDVPQWVLPFQAVRALLWTALTLPVIRMMRGRRWETGLAVALLFSVLMGGNLLRPMDMATGLQTAHFIEVFGENFFFGSIVGGLLSTGERPARNMVKEKTT
ncbi:MAG: hypothetical protein AB8I69_05740 [Anaerolineae bacterium]